MIRLLLFIRRHAWPIAFVIFAGIAVLLGTIFYWFPFRGAKAESYALERQLATQKSEQASLQKLYAAMKDRFQKLESDRDNVLAQTKQLLAEKEVFVTTEAQYKALTADNQKLLEDHRKLEGEYGMLDTKVKELKGSLESALTEVESSKEEAAKIAKEKSDIAHEHEVISGRVRTLEEEVVRYKGFQESFLSLSKSYDELQKERKFLSKKLEDLPKKFSKMARENQILVKETGDMHYNLGVFYAGEMNYDRAIEEFKKAVEINPNDAKAIYNLGYIYAEQRQDRKKAEYYFRTFLGLAPNDPHADEVRTYLVERDVFTTNQLKS